MPLERLARELERSPRTIKRHIRSLRGLNYPIEWDAEGGGYRLVLADGQPAIELPGLFFSASELAALVTMRHLLDTVQPGLFEQDLVPLGRRVEKLLEQTGVSPAEVAHRIRIVAIGGRAAPDFAFRACADAVLSRRRLEVEYRARGRDGEWETRKLSPQRLVRYRDTWYLDAYCHARCDIRVFALDQMREVRILDDAARELPNDEIDELVKGSYGIFTGRPDARAVLRFNARRAQWVSKEHWHENQIGVLRGDGCYELTIPYVGDHPEELLREILKYGPDVEVLEPAELRARAAELVEEAARQYRG